MNREFIYSPPQGPLSIIHQDEHILVIDKPSGLLSVPGKADDHKDCLEARIRKEYPTALTVHRLDMSTSGVCIFGMTPEAQSHLGKQFEKRYTSKTYIARVWGHVEGDEGEIDAPLICDWPNRPKQMVNWDIGKPAHTRWKVLDREENATRVALYPTTGRSHQLRVHMLHIGHPILGDEFYADEAAYNAAPRLQLHARSLTFHHPDGGARIEFTADCPF